MLIRATSPHVLFVVEPIKKSCNVKRPLNTQTAVYAITFALRKDEYLQ